MAARRLELSWLLKALDRCAALVVEDETTAAAVRRWLVREPTIVSGGAGLAQLLSRAAE